MEQLEKYQQQLLKEQVELDALLHQREQASETVELDQACTGRLSRMDALQQQAMEQASKQRAQSRLKLIALALQKINQDEYGYCVECEEPINPQRLMINPAVLYCIDCAK